MILPTGAHSFREGMQIGCEVYHTLSKLIKQRYGMSAANVGDEGGFGVPQIQDENETLVLISEAIEKAGHTGKVGIGLDVAASEFYHNGLYDLGKKSGEDRKLNVDEMIDLYEKMHSNYPILSIEDPFDQDDFPAYQKMQEKLGGKLQIVGDDLLVTNPKRVQTGIDQKLCNSLLLKVNQIGSVSESIDACKLSQ
jgi:enolase